MICRHTYADHVFVLCVYMQIVRVCRRLLTIPYMGYTYLASYVVFTPMCIFPCWNMGNELCPKHMNMYAFVHYISVTYIYIYIYMYIYVYRYIYIYIGICIYIYVYMCIYICIHIEVCVYIRVPCVFCL